jgi:putative (di)nucleoside polyphosphate hydrolase
MSVRKAIGAIITWKDKFLLLRRESILTKNGLTKITPEWDILKGGIEDGESPEDALMRELYEETGSRDYAISKKFVEKLIYGLPDETGFEKQEVTMFMVQYMGNGDDLKSNSEEISEFIFLDKKEMESKIMYTETIEFFKKHT